MINLLITTKCVDCTLGFAHSVPSSNTSNLLEKMYLDRRICSNLVQSTEVDGIFMHQNELASESFFARTDELNYASSIANLSAPPSGNRNVK